MNFIATRLKEYRNYTKRILIPAYNFVKSWVDVLFKFQISFSTFVFRINALFTSTGLSIETIVWTGEIFYELHTQRAKCWKFQLVYFAIWWLVFLIISYRSSIILTGRSSSAFYCRRSFVSVSMKDFLASRCEQEDSLNGISIFSFIPLRLLLICPFEN